ncbi:MAG: GntR family transcriptional regulator [Phycisphaeraceae bacterium JB051]
MTRTPSRSPVLDSILPNIRKQIKAYGPGGKIPTIRELSESLGASQVTVRQAIQVLEQEGLVKAYVGRGTYVTEAKQDSPRNTAKTITVLRSDWPSRRGDELTRAIYNTAKANAYRPVVVTYSDYEQIRDLLAPAIVSDAYVLQPTARCSVELLAFMRSLSANIVVEGMNMGSTDVDSTCANLPQMYYMGLQYLAERGHQRVTLASGEPRKLMQPMHVETCSTLSRSMGLEDPEYPICFAPTQPGECSTKSAREYFAQFIQTHHGKLPFTGMLVFSYASAVGILEALEQAGIRMNDDIEIVVMDNPDIDTELAKDLNIVGVTSQTIGQTIINRLEERWNTADVGHDVVLIVPTFKKAGVRLNHESSINVTMK